MVAPYQDASIRRAWMSAAVMAVVTGLLGHAGATAADLPVIHEQQTLVTDPTVQIRAAAVDGDIIALGAPFDSTAEPRAGAVHVFERPPGGVWIQTALLTDDHASACNNFGRTVDVEGSTLIANHWNWLFTCEEVGASDSRVDGLHVFERGPAGWVQTINRSKFMNQGMDLGFDGTNLVVAFDGSGALALARAADGSWTDAGLQLRSLGLPYQDDETPGLIVDIHNGLAAIGGTHEIRDDNGQYQDLPAATLYRRDGNGPWQRLPDVLVPATSPWRSQPADASLPRVATGPRRRLAINESIFEPDYRGQYVENASLRPACTSHESLVDIEFDEQTSLALVRTRPSRLLSLAPSLWKQAITLHLYRRLSGGRWEAVAQLIPDDDSPANVITGIDYDTSFAIDSGVMVSNGRVYDAAAPTISYVFSNFDPCLGHRGNWIELTPQRWAISHQGGRTYSIVTSDYANQSGNRPGEYALVSHHRFGDFDFTVKARSDEVLGPASAADYVVIFGYQDEQNYYYMMFSRYAINNELFKVVDGARQRIARAPRGSFLDNAFHQVDISRAGSQITILFDGAPYLSATDATFGEGAIGVGSYNDAVSFDDIDIQAVGTSR